MKRIFTGIWLALLTMMVLTGCITKDYNLRTIKDNRVYMEADSTSYRMKWNTSDWVDKYVKNWSSAGVMIMDAENIFPATRKASDWIDKSIDDGFHGLILIDIDVDNLYTRWSSVPTGNKTLFKQTWYLTFLNSGALAKDTSGRGFYDLNNSCRYVDPRLAVSQSYITNAANLTAAYIDTLTNRYSIDTDNIKFGVFFDGYDQDSWKPYTDDPDYIASLNADPLQLGKTIDTYTAVEMEGFNAYYDAWVDAFHSAGIQTVLSGDKILEDYNDNGNYNSSQFVDYSCMGFFFDNVNYSNVDSVITVANSFRTAFTPSTTDSSLLLIAGIRNNVYNTFDVSLGPDGTYPSNPQAYGQMIKKLVDAGIYFTPGGYQSYWDFPETHPGDWWYRVSEDIAWQSNPNNPTYASITSGPRQTFNIVTPWSPGDTGDGGDDGGGDVPGPDPEIPFASNLNVSPKFPGGGWLHGGAILHDESIVLVGADVSGVYASQDYGQTFINWNYGLKTSDEVENYYVNDIIAVKNSYFEGALSATFGGIFEMDVKSVVQGLNVWETITPTDELRYTSFNAVSWDTAQSYYSSIGFSALDWDGKDCVVAAPGRYRWERSNAYPETQYAAGTYPEGVYLHGDDEDMVRNGGPGLYALYKLDYTDEAAGLCKWVVWEVDYGQINDVSMVTSASDTLVLCASNYKGPVLWDNTSWKDLGDGATWYDYDGNIVTPDWNQDGTVGSHSSPDAHPNRVVSVFLTSAGVGYCALVNTEWDWDGSSGLYRCPDVRAVSPEWRFVGDNTQFNFWYSDWGNIRDWLVGEKPFHPNYTVDSPTEYPYLVATYISGHEANATTQDTLFVGDRMGRMGYSRVIVDSSDKDPWVATWEPLLYLYGDANNTAQPQPPLTEFLYEVPSAWGVQSIFEMVIDPETAQRNLAHINARILMTEDGWNTVINGFSEAHPTDADYFRGTGYDETCFNGAGVINTDGQLWYSAGDLGPHTTDGIDWDWIKKNHPLQTFQACSDYNDGVWDGTDRPLTTEFPNTESGGIIVLRNFNDSGNDAVVITGGDIIQRTLWNNMFMFWDSNDDGTMEAYEMTDAIENIDDFKFLGHQHVWDPVNEELFFTYSKYNMSICQNKYSFNLATALTTDNITSVVVSQDIATTVSNVNGSTLNQQGSLYVTRDDSTTVKLHYSSFTGSTFTIDSTNGDFLGDEAGVGVAVWVPEEEVQRTGVMKATWNGSDWSFADVDSAGIPDETYGLASQGYESMALIGRRLFLGMRGDGCSGIYYNDLDGAGTWTQCWGPAFSSVEQDLKTFATDGEKLFFASRGGAGNHGGLFVMDDPTNASASAVHASVTRLCNNQNGVDADYALYSDQVPGVLVADNPILNGRYGTDYSANEHIFEPGNLMVDPYNPDNVYMWLSGGENDLADHCGLWYYDASATNGSRFTQLYTDDVSSGLGSNRGAVTFTSSSVFDYPRIVYGTHCAGIRWFQVQPPDTNLVADSEDFDAATWSWSNYDTDIATDPEGGSTATEFTINGSTTGFSQIVTDEITLTGAETIVASIYVKAGDTPTTDIQRLAVYDQTVGSPDGLCYMRFNIDTGVPVYVDSDNIMDYGIESIGDGWYRVHIVVDRWVVSNLQDTYDFRYMPAGDATPDVGGSVILWGSQVEVNVQKVGTYVHTLGGSEVASLFSFDSFPVYSNYQQSTYTEEFTSADYDSIASLDVAQFHFQLFNEDYWTVLTGMTDSLRTRNDDIILLDYFYLWGVSEDWADDPVGSWKRDYYDLVNDNDFYLRDELDVIVPYVLYDDWHNLLVNFSSPAAVDSISNFIVTRINSSGNLDDYTGIFFDFINYGSYPNWPCGAHNGYPDGNCRSVMDLDNDGVVSDTDGPEYLDELAYYQASCDSLVSKIRRGINTDKFIIAVNGLAYRSSSFAGTIDMAMMEYVDSAFPDDATDWENAYDTYANYLSKDILETPLLMWDVKGMAEDGTTPSEGPLIAASLIGAGTATISATNPVAAGGRYPWSLLRSPYGRLDLGFPTDNTAYAIGDTLYRRYTKGYVKLTDITNYPYEYVVVDSTTSTPQILISSDGWPIW